ncbi:hypothetical protein H5410_026006 [Solanum commersonii]|uniref:Uncharacterized protein n=1 Tax=Solanum commersonii TaxID=4109 RepID=A0A9J5YVT9_SOLCO|nr:hypothetical protein H5410_026006 [Solanum commersonii]
MERNGEGNETKNKNKSKGNQNLQDKVKDQQNELNYNGTKQKNAKSPNSSEEKVENTYPNEELVEKVLPRINLISKSTSLPTKIKNQEPFQLTVELNSEKVGDQPPRAPDNNSKDIINCRKDKDFTASSSTISNREKQGSQTQ